MNLRDYENALKLADYARLYALKSGIKEHNDAVTIAQAELMTTHKNNKCSKRAIATLLNLSLIYEVEN